MSIKMKMHCYSVIASNDMKADHPDVAQFVNVQFQIADHPTIPNGVLHLTLTDPADYAAFEAGQTYDVVLPMGGEPVGSTSDTPNPAPAAPAGPASTNPGDAPAGNASGPSQTSPTAPDASAVSASDASGQPQGDASQTTPPTPDASTPAGDPPPSGPAAA